MYVWLKPNYLVGYVLLGQLCITWSWVMHFWARSVSLSFIIWQSSLEVNPSMCLMVLSWSGFHHMDQIRVVFVFESCVVPYNELKQYLASGIFLMSSLTKKHTTDLEINKWVSVNYPKLMGYITDQVNALWTCSDEST